MILLRLRLVSGLDMAMEVLWISRNAEEAVVVLVIKWQGSSRVTSPRLTA